MNTVTLVIGLIQILGGFCGLMSLACPVFGLPVAITAAALGLIGIVGGANNLMESLFGDEGFFPLFAVEGDESGK